MTRVADVLARICENPTSTMGAGQSLATSTQFGSSPFNSTMPSFGTMLSSRRKLSLISSRSRKISAWSNSMLFTINNSGR